MENLNSSPDDIHVDPAELNPNPDHINVDTAVSIRNQSISRLVRLVKARDISELTEGLSPETQQKFLEQHQNTTRARRLSDIAKFRGRF